MSVVISFVTLNQRVSLAEIRATQEIDEHHDPTAAQQHFHGRHPLNGLLISRPGLGYQWGSVAGDIELHAMCQASVPSDRGKVGGTSGSDWLGGFVFHLNVYAHPLADA